MRSQQRPLLDDGRSGVRGGDPVDFHGVKMSWAGDMTGAEMIAQFQSAYVPSLIQRNTNWIFHAGKPVHLLREPSGTVWVLQEYTKAVDPSLTPDNLNTVGSKLKLPQAGSSRPRCSPRTSRWIPVAPAAGPRSFATSWNTYQGCGYGKTSVLTMCRNSDEAGREGGDIHRDGSSSDQGSAVGGQQASEDETDDAWVFM